MLKWTQDESRVAEYLKLYYIDVTHQKIADALGITRNASVSYAARKNLPPRRLRVVRADKKPYVRPSRAKPKVPLPNATSSTQPTPAVSAVFKPPPERHLPTSNPVKIWELQFHHCRWPLGDPSATMDYCGAPRTEGPYCSEHHKLSRRAP